MSKTESQPVSVVLEGIIFPWGWDGENRVTNVLLCAKGERDYYVEKDMQGDALIPFCGRHMEVHGVLRRDKGLPLLKVVSFTEKEFL